MPAPEPPLVRAHLATLRHLERAHRLGHGLATGIFLGLMDERALAVLDEAYYDGATRATRTDFADPAHIRGGLDDWERDVLERHVPAGARLTITGAGAGRELWGALELGLVPRAFEPHPGLRAAGDAQLRREGRPERVEPCARDAFPAAITSTDAVLVGWGSYSHIASRDRRIAFLRDARSVLPAGAPLVLSFWALSHRDRYLRTVWRLARPVRRLVGGPPPELGDLLSPTFFHCFDEAEVRAELEAAGFTPVSYAPRPYPHAVGRAR